MARHDPWTVEVDVYLLSDANPRQPEFEFDSFLKDDEGRLRFRNNGRPGFNIVFHLHDETGCGYQFPSQPKLKDAVWSKLGTACPDEECWEVFDPVRVFENGKSLVVRNENPCPAQGEFHYTLRVTKDGRTYLPLDPGGFNQNGNVR